MLSSVELAVEPWPGLDSFYKQRQITIPFMATFHGGHAMIARAGLSKASSVGAYGRAAGSTLSTTARTCGRPGVLYEDRGVIVLNKPPGLVSQGTSRAVDAKNDYPETTPPRAAFDDVLDGTVQLLVTL
jgi:hypothetical protein